MQITKADYVPVQVSGEPADTPAGAGFDEAGLGADDRILAVLDAAHFAALKHRKQRRKDADASPYINHPLALARTLAAGGVIDTEVLCAALLHDTVECPLSSRFPLLLCLGHRTSPQDRLRHCTMVFLDIPLLAPCAVHAVVCRRNMRTTCRVSTLVPSCSLPLLAPQVLVLSVLHIIPSLFYRGLVQQYALAN